MKKFALLFVAAIILAIAVPASITAADNSANTELLSSAPSAIQEGDTTSTKKACCDKDCTKPCCADKKAECDKTKAEKKECHKEKTEAAE